MTAVAAFATAIVAVAWIAVLAMLRGQYVDQIEDEYRQNANLASALTEQTLRVFAAIDEATLRVADTVARRQIPDLERIAGETGLAPDILVQLSLIDDAGRFVGSNLDPDGSHSQHVDLSTRDHVRVHLSPAHAPDLVARVTPNGLYVGQAVLGKVSNKWTIQLSRKIVGPGGVALGVVVASLDPRYFESVYKRVALGRTGGVVLFGSDLAIRARVAGGESAGMGSVLPRGGEMDARLSSEVGHYSKLSSLDGGERLVAFRRVANYPLYLAVSSGAEEALSTWRSNCIVTVALAALLSIGLLAAAIAILGGLQRLERTNAALVASEHEARAASEAKTAFLAAVSHELRTPLTSIRGYAELIEHRATEPAFRDHAGTIRKGAERLNDLLTEILDLANLEAGSLIARTERVDLRSLIARVIDKHAPVAQTKGLVLSVDIDPDVPATLDADSDRLAQVLDNLLSNALKFTSQGTVRVIAQRKLEKILVHVEDTGPGIPEDMQHVVFERFRQGDSRVSYEHGGAGIGLALSRSLAELMRGSLTLRSRPGAGCRFTLSMPTNTSVVPA